MKLSEYREHLSGAEQLQSRLFELTAEIVNCPLLKTIESGNLTKEQWRKFAEQRYLASQKFESLLEAGINSAKHADFAELAGVLTRNLQDEQGLDQEGNKLKEGAHQKWRKDFYLAMGLSDQTLASAEPEGIAEKYQQTLNNLIESGNALEIAGAILFQEYSIPEEFKQLERGRDITFAEEFQAHESDTPEQRHQKSLARLYLRHHIAHDAELHYPDLEKALEKYTDQPDKLNQILRGVEKMANAKKVFLEGLKEITKSSASN